MHIFVIAFLFFASCKEIVSQDYVCLSRKRLSVVDNRPKSSVLNKKHGLKSHKNVHLCQCNERKKYTGNPQRFVRLIFLSLLNVLFNETIYKLTCPKNQFPCLLVNETDRPKRLQ